jgi:hypothetical protein
LKEYSIFSNKSSEVYSVHLFFDEKGVLTEKSNCTCKHGSFYRYTQKNIQAKRWKCSHIREALKKHENNEPDNIEIEKQNEKQTKPKQIEPIFQ